VAFYNRGCTATYHRSRLPGTLSSAARYAKEEVDRRRNRTGYTGSDSSTQNTIREDHNRAGMVSPDIGTVLGNNEA